MLKKRAREEEVDESPANSEHDDVMCENDDEEADDTDEDEDEDEEADDTNEDEDEGECQECGFLVLSSNPEDHQFCTPAEAGEEGEEEDDPKLPDNHEK